MKYMDRILEESKNLAYNYYKAFCIKLNLNYDAFSHIYNVNIKYGKVYDKNAVAEYDPYSNQIFINYKYFINLDEQDLKRELPIAMLHELIHAKRKNFIKENLDFKRIELALIYEDITTQKKHLNNKELQKEELIKLKGQYAFEEIITETIAIIMYASRSQTNIDLYEIIKIMHNSTSTQDLAGTIFINEMGFEFIEWFMKASNDNLMKKTFKDKYNQLLNCFITLYTDKEPGDREFEKMDEMEDIIKQKTKCL